MRVLHVLPSIAATRGGPTYVLLNLVRALLREDVEVDVLTTDADLDGDEQERARCALAPAHLSVERTLGPARLDFAPRFLFSLTRLLLRADIVHVHTVFTYPAAITPLVCRAMRKPYVIRTVGTLDAMCIASRSSWQKELLLDVVGNRNLLGAGAVHVTSDFEATQIRTLLPTAAIENIGIGVQPPSESRPDAGARGTRIGYLGRIHPIKRIETLIDSLPLLGDEVTLTIAGSGAPDYVEQLRQRADSLACGGRIRWLGHVGDREKSAFISECDVLAFPSEHESFGIAVAEAMAAGRAVVVSPEVALSKEIVESDAGVMATADAPTFARALERLLSDGAERARLASRGQELARARWSWSTIGSEVLAMYRRILTGAGARR